MLCVLSTPGPAPAAVEWFVGLNWQAPWPQSLMEHPKFEGRPSQEA